jgi:tRNA(Ile)-lysidine synthase
MNVLKSSGDSVGRSVEMRSVISRLARRVADSARNTHLFRPADRILVAVSGGPDSVALLSALVELAPFWNLGLWAVHINHGLRGEESEEDARFVAGLCDRLRVALVHERSMLTGPLGRPKGRSLQEHAREIRYRTMVRVGRVVDADKIALGHTADDQAETVLMWMLRGAGTAGLAGIPPVRDSLFIRPFLDVSRSDILEYLGERNLGFRLDSSNEKPVYFRNRVRHELLPVLKRLNPAIVDVLNRQADILREDDSCLQQRAHEHLTRLAAADPCGDVLIDRSGLLALPLALQRRVVRAVIRQVSGINQGPTFGALASVLEKVVHGPSGSGVAVQAMHVAREYGRIRFRSLRFSRQRGSAADAVVEEAKTEMALSVPATVRWPLTGGFIRVSVDRSSAGATPLATRPSGHRAVLDADRFTMKLLVRSWRPGDAFHPLGMQGRRKKLQDYFADIKLPRHERGKVPLVVAPEGILWVGGYRSDHRFRVTSETTRTLAVELMSDGWEGGEP